MKFLFVCVCLILPNLNSSLDLGRGGVYNSPEAQAYWAKRFGFSFGGSGGIRAIQEKVNSEAASNRGSLSSSLESTSSSLEDEEEILPVIVSNSVERSGRFNPRFYRFRRFSSRFG